MCIIVWKKRKKKAVSIKQWVLHWRTCTAVYSVQLVLLLTFSLFCEDFRGRQATVVFSKRPSTCRKTGKSRLTDWKNDNAYSRSISELIRSWYSLCNIWKTEGEVSRTKAEGYLFKTAFLRFVFWITKLKWVRDFLGLVLDCVTRHRYDGKPRQHQHAVKTCT